MHWATWVLLSNCLFGGLCLCRGTGRDVAADERSAAAHSLMAAPVEDTLLQAYPDIYDITQPDGAWGTEQGGKVGGAGADMQPCGAPAVPSLELCEGMQLMLQCTAPLT
jgi:hypothetical protein